MSLNYLPDSESACKPEHRRSPSPLERFATLAGGGAALPVTAPHG
jgi:hypothetical protein